MSRELTGDERSLLLFFEDCAVNKSGGVGGAHMNEDDIAIAKRWAKEGFIKFGRLKMRVIDKLTGIGKSTHYVVLSNEAWAFAATERKARAIRLLKSKNFIPAFLREEGVVGVLPSGESK